MNTPAVDPALIMQDAAQKDLIRRKIDMDALRRRLGDTSTKQEKLRESCEGFESIFLQKMWEQMRKNVPKEGYLHSKDEETYQSLFDIELCKKMASAGGIGLADMLYQQLAQKLEDTGRTTSPGAYRTPMQMASAEFMPYIAGSSPTPEAALAGRGDGKLTAENLYSPLPEEKAENEKEEENSKISMPKVLSQIDAALKDLRTELGIAEADAPGAAAAAGAAQRTTMVDSALEALKNEAALQQGEAALRQGEAAPRQGEAAPRQGEAAPRQGEAAPKQNETGLGQQFSAMFPPVAETRATPPAGAPAGREQTMDHKTAETNARIFGRDKNTQAVKQRAAKAAEQAFAVPASARGMAPQNTLWPCEGTVISKFGWEDDPAGGKRRWNSGVDIATAPGASVQAVLDGTVVFSGQREGFGHSVVLEHKEGFRSYYSRLEGDSLRVGDKVKHGTNFAKVAVQPFSPDRGENFASLYFEFKRGEMALNPESAIRRMTTASK